MKAGILDGLRSLARRLPVPVVALVVAAELSAGPGLCQAPPPEAAPVQPQVLSMGEIVPGALGLAVRRKRLEEDLARVRDLRVQDSRLDLLDERRELLEARVEDLKSAARFDLDRLGDLRQLLSESSRALQVVVADASSRLASIEAWKKEWQAEEALWRGSAAALPKGERSNELEPAFRSARQDIREALDLLADAEPVLVGLQRRAAQLEDAVESVSGYVEEAARETRRQMFQRSWPSLFERDFYAQLGPALWQTLTTRVGALFGAAAVVPAGRTSWAVLVQLALGLALVGIIRARGARISERWQFVAQRPFSAGVFAALSVSWALRTELPVLWQLLEFGGILVSTVRLSAALMKHAWRARLLYLLATVLLLFEVLSLARLPDPLFRLYILVVAVAGGGLCWWRAEENRRLQGPHWYIAGLRFGVAVLAVVLMAEAGGYSGFARHVLEASLRTVFLLIYVRMASLLGAGAIEFLLRHPVAQKSPIVRKEWGVLLQRSGLALDVGLWLLGAMAFLRVWGVYETLPRAWHGIFSLGFSLGETRITLGLVTGAAIALYASLFVSWVVQRVLDEEVYPRRGLEMGVRVSVNRLIQYAFVLVGVLIASSLLGFGMDRVTILAGAFGVGIGFGLQTIVNNFVSGLILLFERPIKVGDVVDVDGQWAVVKTLGLRATVVQTYGRAEVIVPNSELVSGRVTNLTLGDRINRVSIPVGVAYGSDVPKVLQILGEVARGNLRVRENPEPQILFMAFGASSLDFEVRVYVDLDDVVVVRSEILQEIDRRFRLAGVEIPFPQRDLHLRTVDERARSALASLKPDAAGAGVEQARGDAEAVPETKP